MPYQQKKPIFAIFRSYIRKPLIIEDQQTIIILLNLMLDTHSAIQPVYSDLITLLMLDFPSFYFIY